MKDKIKIFALNCSKSFGERVCNYLNVPLTEHKEDEFDDGEHKSFSLTNVRGRDCFVICSIYSDNKQSVHDKLCRLLFFGGSLQDASAGRTVAVVPYLSYSRQDRKTSSREPITTKYVARLFKSAGFDRVITLDVHNLAAFQNAFSICTDHLESRLIFANYFYSKLGNRNLAVVSPDANGMGRARHFRKAMEFYTKRPIPLAFMDKEHSGKMIRGDNIIGDVKNRTVIIVDDMVSSYTTLYHTVRACMNAGAEEVYACATHGLFVGNANGLLEEDKYIKKLVVSDTIDPFRLDPNIRASKLQVLSTTDLFGEAIRRIHSGESISSLLTLDNGI